LFGSSSVGKETRLEAFEMARRIEGIMDLAVVLAVGAVKNERGPGRFIEEATPRTVVHQPAA